MAKKIISLFLIAVMLFTLSCCGKNEDEDNSGVYNPDTVTTQGNTENDSTQSTSDAVKIPVPEGYTALKIAWLLEENGISDPPSMKLRQPRMYDLPVFEGP